MVDTKKRLQMLAKLDAARALEFTKLREGAPLDAVREAIADTIITVQFCRRGTRRLTRYPPRLRSAIDLVIRSLEENASKPWTKPFEIPDARLKSLLRAYRLRVTFQHAYPMELTNILILTLAGILRAVVDSRRPLENLPAILNTTHVLSDTGSKWSRQAVNKRLTRSRGPQMSDLAALIPLTKQPTLHRFRKPFVVFELKSFNTCIVLLSPAQPPASLLPPPAQPTSPEEADRVLGNELLPVITPLFPQLGIPYMTCSKKA